MANKPRKVKFPFQRVMTSMGSKKYFNSTNPLRGHWMVKHECKNHIYFFLPLLIPKVGSRWFPSPYTTLGWFKGNHTEVYNKIKWRQHKYIKIFKVEYKIVLQTFPSIWAILTRLWSLLSQPGWVISPYLPSYS